MSLFSISEHCHGGRAKRLYQRSYDLLAYLEITEASGRRISIEKVAVGNDVMVHLELGATGEFFVDRIFRLSQRFRCQLFGIKTDGVGVLDCRDLRKRTIVAQLILGLALTPLFGIGLVLVVPNLLKALPDQSSCLRQITAFTLV